MEIVNDCHVHLASSVPTEVRTKPVGKAAYKKRLLEETPSKMLKGMDKNGVDKVILLSGTDIDKIDIVKLLDKLYISRLEYLKEVLKQIKNRGYLFRICGPEYATPPYLSPEYFEKFVCKYDKEFIRLIRESGNFSRIHSHGKISSVFDKILDMAPDGLDPIEAPHNGDILFKDAKARSKGKLCLFGNIQLRDLENAKPLEMEKIVKYCMADAKEGGRYVIMPTAAPINVPLSPITERNYGIFIEAALRYGKY